MLLQGNEGVFNVAEEKFVLKQYSRRSVADLSLGIPPTPAAADEVTPGSNNNYNGHVLRYRISLNPTCASC